MRIDVGFLASKSLNNQSSAKKTGNLPELCWGENERQSENFGGGGFPAIPILKSVIGTAATQKRPSVEPCSFLLRVCLFVISSIRGLW